MLIQVAYGATVFYFGYLLGTVDRSGRVAYLAVVAVLWAGAAVFR